MTGVIVSNPPLVEQPPGQTSSDPAGLPGTTYIQAAINLAQTWTAKQTFTLGNISLNAADVLGLSSSATIDTTNAANITSGTLPAARLPVPSSSTLGGVESAAAVSHNWINSISTSGVPSLSQPAFSDISGSIAASQIPNPSASTLGGILSAAPVSNQWINSISTSGVPALSQPAFTDISGTVATAQLANNAVTNAKSAQMAAATLKGNPTASLANASDFTIQGLTNLAAPHATLDFVPVYDHVSGTLKSATPASIGSAGSVSSIAGNTGAFTLGYGLTNVVNDLRASLTTASNVLGADVALNSAGTFFDGPSMAQGVGSSTWYAIGTVTLLDTGASRNFNVKLWDGTTVIASAQTSSSGANSPVTVTLSGFLASPVANIRISVSEPVGTLGKIIFNASGLSKDSSIYGIRIA